MENLTVETPQEIETQKVFQEKEKPRGAIRKFRNLISKSIQVALTITSIATSAHLPGCVHKPAIRLPAQAEGMNRQLCILCLSNERCDQMFMPVFRGVSEEDKRTISNYAISSYTELEKRARDRLVKNLRKKYSNITVRDISKDFKGKIEDPEVVFDEIIERQHLETALILTRCDDVIAYRISDETSSSFNLSFELYNVEASETLTHGRVSIPIVGFNTFIFDKLDSLLREKYNPTVLSALSREEYLYRKVIWSKLAEDANAYLAEFPDGPHVNEVKAILEEQRKKN